MLKLCGQVSFVVPYGKTVKELLVLGKYSSLCLDISESNFPLEAWEHCLVGELLLFEIFCVQRAMEFEEVAICLDRKNRRGASLRQGLAFGIEKPLIHEKISLTLPGSSWRNPKTAFQIRNVPELYSISGSRHVYLRQLDAVYPEGTFFLSVVIGSQK